MEEKRLKFKESANEIRVENIQLRTKIKQLDAEIEKKARLIQLLREKIKRPNLVSANQAIEASSIINLKKHYKELRNKLQERTDVCNEMQEVTNSSSRRLLEEQIKYLGAKCKSIKNCIDKRVKNDEISEEEVKEVNEMEKKLKLQNEQLNVLNKKSEQLDIMLKRRQSEINDLQDNIHQLQEKARQYGVNERDYTKTSHKVATSNKELADLRVKLNEVQPEEYQLKVKELIKEQEELRQLIECKEQEIGEYNSERKKLKKQIEECMD